MRLVCALAQQPFARNLTLRSDAEQERRTAFENDTAKFHPEYIRRAVIG